MPTVRCKTCRHKALAEIDALLMTMEVDPETGEKKGPSYEDIIMRMRVAYPQEEVLTTSGLSRHKNDHLLTKPLAIENKATGEITYLGNQKLLQQPVTAADIPAIPTTKEVLKFIIAAGLQNIARNPHLVGPKVLTEAVAQLEAMGEGSDDDNFKEAWAKLAAEQKKASGRTRVSRTTTVREEVELPAAEVPADPPAEPLDWSFDELPALPEVIDVTPTE